MIPIEIDQKRKAKSIGSFTAVRNRTMDNAPTMPKEITILDCMVRIIQAVIIAITVSETAKLFE